MHTCCIHELALACALVHTREYVCAHSTRVCACVCEFRGYWLWTGTFLKKSTQTTTPPSVQGAIFHTKESFEEREEKGREKKQILKCAPKKGRLKAPLFPPFFLAPFFAAIERNRMIVGCSRWGWGGWGGLLNRPQRFYRFPLSPPWRTSDLWGGRMRERGGRQR